MKPMMNILLLNAPIRSLCILTLILLFLILILILYLSLSHTRTPATAAHDKSSLTEIHLSMGKNVMASVRAHEKRRAVCVKMTKCGDNWKGLELSAKQQWSWTFIPFRGTRKQNNTKQHKKLYWRNRTQNLHSNVFALFALIKAEWNAPL